MMWVRLLVTVLLLGMGTAVFYLFRHWHMQRLTALPANVPTILYFRSDSCAACPTQHRYLDQLQALWHGRLQIQPIDVDREQETAVKYGVFTLPTTLIIDESGKIRQINYGLTNSHKLQQQLAQLSTKEMAQ
jgi:thioredoxin-like negative regulator of GroEL